MRWRLWLELHDREAVDHLEVSNVECDHVVAYVQCRRTDQQVFEGDVDTTSCLFALEAASKLRDFYGHWMHHHVTAEFFAKGPPPLAVSIAFGPVDAVGQFDDGHNRERGVNFPVRSLHSLEDLPHTFPATFPSDEYAGVEDYSDVETLRGLRLLMISSRSAAKSGSIVGS